MLMCEEAKNYVVNEAELIALVAGCCSRKHLHNIVFSSTVTNPGTWSYIVPQLSLFESNSQRVASQRLHLWSIFGFSCQRDCSISFQHLSLLFLSSRFIYCCVPLLHHQQNNVLEIA